MEFVQRKKHNNKSLVVVTVLGPQSSGKSTLLNYLFGTKFNVSAGRCTKGLNAVLLRTNIDKSDQHASLDEAKEILVLDSEGLFSLEKGDQEYDKNLVVFCMAVSNLLLINMKGELSREVEDILQ